jgi:hypothetical protein
MSQNGNTQNSLAIQKKNLLNQKIGGTNYSNLEFSHVASGGETVINFNSLVADSSLVSLEGFSNPSPTQLIAGKITQNKGNVFLHSTARGQLMRGQEFYIREDNQIRLTYEAEENEIFHGMINNVVRTTPSLLDVKKISFTGELAEGATDVVVGAEYNINANPSTQLGDLVVYRWQGSETPKLMVRCEGNDLLNDGNYIEKLNAIEFKEGGRVGGENIAVFSPNCIPVEFQGSFKTDLETIGGQVDLISEFLQDVHSLPTNPFQGAPNQVDLRAFGNQVLEALNRLQVIENKTVNVANEEAIVYTGFSGKNSGSNEIIFSTQLENTSSELITYGEVPESRVTFLEDCYFTAHVTVNASAQNTATILNLFASAGFVKYRGLNDLSLTGSSTAMITGFARKGDFITAVNTATPIDNSSTSFAVTARRIVPTLVKDLI